MFQIHGCRVIGVDPVAERRKLAQRCGIGHTVGGTAEEAQAEIHEITKGDLANITVDAVGHSGVVMQALRATADHGQIIILGSPRVRVDGDLTGTPLRHASAVDYHSRGVRMVRPHGIPMSVTALRNGVNSRTILTGWRGMELHVAPLISHRLKPERIKQAYDGLLNEPNVYTGVVLEWTSDSVGS